MSVIEQFHGIKTPDGLGLHVVLAGPAPEGLPPEQFWPVNAAVPEGHVRTGWQLVNDIVEPVLEPVVVNNSPYRVSKDTIISRVPADKLSQVIAALASQSPEDQFKWINSAWFWSNNQTIRGMATALGIDPEMLLAPDPYL